MAKGDEVAKAVGSAAAGAGVVAGVRRGLKTPVS